MLQVPPFGIDMNGDGELEEKKLETECLLLSHFYLFRQSYFYTHEDILLPQGSFLVQLLLFY